MFRKICCAAAFVLLVCAIASCKTQRLPVKKLALIKADGEKLTVSAEVAKTPSEREHGFMGRKKIPDGTGMLFVFENDQILHFWMKNTPHPLSSAYIDRNGVIQNIFNMTPFSLASVSSTVSTRYALEVPQGWFEKVGIDVGDKLELDF